ncbi:SusC/RagA family TonB-linked outer membrane protein [Flavihumibacter petaseus]|uniref:Putative TonB-dependent receptor n=1 Tax=Flavihumibacter petaseus NBRC 106054 TaxID=1220578 RepID=A0A0E9N023_9BACT|nr:TonB-dependent receptor [Flavihumibacter petaseus]GAO43352.1 putative TonB-dependent receptor [Flavihumibacter petaseus NBRC 106054]
MISLQFLPRVLFLLILSLSVTGLVAQTTITGKIADTDGKAVSGATVTVKGQKAGVAADTEGAFSISVPPGTKFLVISSVGYAEQEVDIAGKSVVSVVLTPESKTYSDVVVVGYGTVRRRDATAAIASIGSKDFSSGIIVNPMQQIQGKIAGLSITQAGGDPNSNPIIRLRGQTSLSGGQTPLIVLDGIPLDDPNQISSIPPGDITSYDILKDVSATAIYGSRGANGVIIINTKKGTAGRTRVEYNGFAAMDRLAKGFDLANADEWRQANQLAGVDPATIASYDKGANTDWADAITRTAFTHSHNVAVSGGTGGFNYRASVSYMDQEGIVINTGKEQFAVRFNAQQKAMKNKLDLQVSVFNNHNNRNYADYAIFAYINTTPPVYPVYNPDGSYYAYNGFEQQNPVARQELQTNKAVDDLTQILGRADYEIIRGLKLGVLGSISRYNIQTQNFTPTLPGVGNITTGSQANSNLNSKKGDVHLNYNKDFGRHNIAATAVYEYNEFNNQRFNAGGQDFLVPDLGVDYLQGGNPALNTIGSYRDQFKIISFLGRVAYNYDQRYYATVSLRRDGSSKFGENNRWGTFPAVSAAWRISGESFMQGIYWLSDLKLSAGYGVVGNQDAISPYNTLLTLGGSTRYLDLGNPSYLFPQSYTPNQNANPDLKWEERHGTNIGLSFGLFDNRFTGNINWYNDKTKNLLFNYQVPIPPFFYNTILANVGELTNKGVEIQLNADVTRGKKFQWNIGGQITFSKTRITSLSGSFAGLDIKTDDVRMGQATGRGYANNYITFLKVGYAPYVFYLPEFAGVSKEIDPTTQSNQQYYDENGELTYSVTAARKKYIDPSQNFNYGINSTMAYGKWGFNFFLRGVSGQKVFNNYQNITSNLSRLPGNNITKQGLTNGIRGSQTASDYWLEDAGFMRLDNATLSYTFGEVGAFESLRLYLTGTNLFVITNYTGQDPEIANGNSVQSYIDANVSGLGFYPRSRTLTLGINLSLK